MHVCVYARKDSTKCDAVFYVMDIGSAADTDSLTLKSSNILVGTKQLLYEL